MCECVCKRGRLERWRENLPLVCFVTSWLVNLKVTVWEKKHTQMWRWKQKHHHQTYNWSCVSEPILKSTFEHPAVSFLRFNIFFSRSTWRVPVYQTADDQTASRSSYSLGSPVALIVWSFCCCLCHWFAVPLCYYLFPSIKISETGVEMTAAILREE